MHFSKKSSVGGQFHREGAAMSSEQSTFTGTKDGYSRPVKEICTGNKQYLLLRWVFLKISFTYF